MTLKVEAVLKMKTEWEATEFHVVLECCGFMNS